MRLVDLEPFFVRHETRVETTGPREYLIHVPTLAEAQSVEFLCPVCFAKNAGPVGTHGVMVTFEGRGATDTQGSRNGSGAPSRWQVSGTDLTDLTLRPSIDLGSHGCGWHGYITNGEVT